MSPQAELVGGERLLAYGEGLRQVYADAFAQPPWGADEAMAEAYMERLAVDVTRPGFVAALARDGARVLGFATAWTTPDPFPADRGYPLAAAALGPERTGSWLCGAREVDELAVRTRARGLGLGAGLLRLVTDAAEDGRCWLLTSVRARSTVRFYRRMGWRQVDRPAPESGDVTVFLGPRHPAVLTF
ncbi:GNAT family N-acetyltransferase [Streptomyces sp. NPDC051776]|uniref:GNAT family N-acetyltransferase n=1 Tax=Streptomyces sp. NPDC051776 TaxID=3155414 RepID=UPI0034376709